MNAQLDLFDSNLWQSVAIEQMGDLREALRFRRESLTDAVTLAKEEPANPQNHEYEEDARAQCVRLLSLLDGEKADYVSIPGVAGASPRRIRWLMARSWRNLAQEINYTSSRTPVEAADKSVQMFRVLVSENRDDSIRELALSLERLGLEFKYIARGKAGQEQANLLRKSRDAHVESRDIFQSLNSPSDANVMTDLMRDIATADAKLALTKVAAK